MPQDGFILRQDSFPPLAEQGHPDFPNLWKYVSGNMDIIFVRTLKLAALKVVHQVAQERNGLGHRAALRFVLVLQEVDVVHCLTLLLPSPGGGEFRRPAIAAPAV
jgi:hypothetical protein